MTGTSNRGPGFLLGDPSPALVMRILIKKQKNKVHAKRLYIPVILMKDAADGQRYPYNLETYVQLLPKSALEKHRISNKKEPPISGLLFVFASVWCRALEVEQHFRIGGQRPVIR